MRNLTFALFISSMALLFCSCGGSGGDFSDDELSLISECDSIMRVLTIESPEDSLVLRADCSDLSVCALQSCSFAHLCSLMVATVTHPSQDGVGIAGPQVGLSRRVVAVQRFDKEGEPFEVYGNIRIVKVHGEKSSGPEGCLSVPDMRGDVMRWQDIEIEYDAVTRAGKDGWEGMDPIVSVGKSRECITGFTAVIFQHETDHLDGILYTDRL